MDVDRDERPGPVNTRGNDLNIKLDSVE